MCSPLKFMQELCFLGQTAFSVIGKQFQETKVIDGESIFIAKTAFLLLKQHFHDTTIKNSLSILVL